LTQITSKYRAKCGFRLPGLFNNREQRHRLHLRHLFKRLQHHDNELQRGQLYQRHLFCRGSEFQHPQLQRLNNARLGHSHLPDCGFKQGEHHQHHGLLLLHY
jgi:hypothetical protein